MDANHCAGAVMILFDGYFGRTLYTGDFRFNKDIFFKYKFLYPPQYGDPFNGGGSIPIEVLHLDNTFLSEKFNFPPQ